MLSFRCTLIMIAVGFSFMLPLSVVADIPAVFTSNTFADARTEAKESNKLFIIDATAVWCGPCKRMDKTTWVDPKVMSWLEEHAVTAQLDVDRFKVIARTLKIRAMPTIIAFKDGEEFDRVIGYKSAEQLLTWLDGVREGKRAIDALRVKAGNRNIQDGKVDIGAQYSLAQELMRSGELDDATDEFIWLWDNMLKHQQSMYGVRLSFMASDMTRLANQHEPAKKAFTKLRDRNMKSIDSGSARRDELIDWIHLNDIIDDEDATLQWYDRVKDDPKSSAMIKLVDRNLFDLLIAHDRWADAGHVYLDPVSHINQLLAVRARTRKILRQQMKDESDERLRMREEYVHNNFRELTSNLYAACLAAGREKSAAKIAEILLEQQNDEPARFSLVETALLADQPRQEQNTWLDEAEASGERNDPLRKRLAEALIEYKRQASEK